MQINHPGRQAAISIDPLVAPSAVPIKATGIVPRALEESEIHDVIARFANVAANAKACGYTGVQVHAAHGYLLSQFLSPLTNQRTDRWGGSLENRARLLLEVVRAVRSEVGGALPVSVKMNSADFQKGGFTEDDSVMVARWLDREQIDLLEISGGSYESMVMIGYDQQEIKLAGKKTSTLVREAYFMGFAARVRPVVSIPLMITGGFQSLNAMTQAIGSGACDIVGLARPLCIEPDTCKFLLSGEVPVVSSVERTLTFVEKRTTGGDPDKVGHLDSVYDIAYYYNQIRRIASGLDPELVIDWDEQLGRHQAFESQAAAAYRGSFNRVSQQS